VHEMIITVNPETTGETISYGEFLYLMKCIDEL
jgi:hypothetical protein